MNAIWWKRSLLAAALALPGFSVVHGETALSLKSFDGVELIEDSKVTIPALEAVSISVPDLGPRQWFKDGKPIAGENGTTLTIMSAGPGDSGIYHVVYSESGPPYEELFSEEGVPTNGTQRLVLIVKPAERLVNLSTRARIGQGEDTFIAGFAVTGHASKKIIVRAVGPSLAMFNVSDPVLHPKIEVFDSKGKLYTASYIYADCVGCPNYADDLAESLTKCGAFPLPDGTGDIVQLRPFAPGNYTAHVTSTDNVPGVVLLEIYEVP